MKKSNLLLSIETSAEVCSVALSSDGMLLHEISSYGRNVHDELMAESVSTIFNYASVGVSDLAAIAVSAGPGSFTGLRIGAAFAKALCFGGKPEFIAVPTLDAYAFNAIAVGKALSKSKIIAIIPSHKNLYYYREYDLDARPLGNIITAEKNEIDAIITSSHLACGTGAGKLGLSDLEAYNIPSGKMIAQKAWQMFTNNDFTDAEKFVPEYIQEFIPKSSTKSLNL